MFGEHGDTGNRLLITSNNKAKFQIGQVSESQYGNNTIVALEKIKLKIKTRYIDKSKSRDHVGN